MPYAARTDIEAEFKDITFGVTGTAIIQSEVEEFILQEEAIINASINNLYDVPVTDTESVLILKKISIAFVAYRVAKILNLKKEVPIPDEFITQTLDEGSFYVTARKQLALIVNGTIVLTGATARSTDQAVKSYNSDNSILPLWERDTKQW